MLEDFKMPITSLREDILNVWGRLWSFISIDRYIAVTDPLVYPTKFTVSVSGICISISWILPLTYSGAVFYTGANENGLEELSSALNCVGGCQTVVNQNWVLIDFLSFFIPTLVMIILYSNIFLVARHQAKKIENTGSKTESSSDSYKSRVAKRERKAAKTLGITVIAFMISWLPYSIDSLIDAFMGFITPAYIYEICCWCTYYNCTTWHSYQTSQNLHHCQRDTQKASR